LEDPARSWRGAQGVWSARARPCGEAEYERRALARSPGRDDDHADTSRDALQARLATLGTELQHFTEAIAQDGAALPTVIAAIAPWQSHSSTVDADSCSATTPRARTSCRRPVKMPTRPWPKMRRIRTTDVVYRFYCSFS